MKIAVFRLIKIQLYFGVFVIKLLRNYTLYKITLNKDIKKPDYFCNRVFLIFFSNID